MQKSRFYYLVIFVLFGSLFGITQVQTLLPHSNTSSNLKIIHPANESNVNQFGEDIEFGSNSAIGKSYVPVVFIKDPINQWWPWLQSKSLDNGRKNWSLKKVQFGSNEDSGLEFQIQVLVIPRGDLDNGIILQGGDRFFIEAGEPIRNRIFVTVLRNKYPTQSNVVVVTSSARL